MKKPPAFTHCQDFDVRCYRSLFDIECHLRAVVRWELRGKRGSNWKGLISPEALQEARRRREQERGLRLVSSQPGAVLSYLNLSELKDLLLGPMWELGIKDDWPPRDIVQAEFKKLIAIRNKVAHFRSATSRDHRVVERFSQDLREWTEHYLRQRRLAMWANLEGEVVVDQIRKKNSLIASWWEVRASSPPTKDLEVQLGIVGSHIALRAELLAGSVNPEAFIDAIDRHEKFLSFIRLDDLARNIEFYIPSEHGTSIECLDALDRVLRTPGRGLSSDEVRDGFPFAEREGLIPFSIELPPAFRPT